MLPFGSPPQVRGKPRSWRILPRVFGITPAGAGKTAYGIRSVPYDEDHPRRCGENSGGVFVRLIVLGSPPQVRGKLIFEIQNSQARRITPAGAGKT